MKDWGSIVFFNVVDFLGIIFLFDIVWKFVVRFNFKFLVGNFNNFGLLNLLGGLLYEMLYDIRIIDENWGFMVVWVFFGVVFNFVDVYRLV